MASSSNNNFDHSPLSDDEEHSDSSVGELESDFEESNTDIQPLILNDEIKTEIISRAANIVKEMINDENAHNLRESNEKLTLLMDKLSKVDYELAMKAQTAILNHLSESHNLGFRIFNIIYKIFKGGIMFGVLWLLWKDQASRSK